MLPALFSCCGRITNSAAGGNDGASDSRRESWLVFRDSLRAGGELRGQRRAARG